ncbi:hypothetical protein [Marinimicrobium sp. C2-29]|uniref:hypothetical protein n=1 Tax=Marinimicrobium sp. C2-29 TaxID=3139825 RepID=UPI00313A104D
MNTKMSSRKAWNWHRQHNWLCGFNYLPRTAVNWNEMWQKESFDEETIRQELSWAADVGYNSLRTNLPFIVWEQSPRELKDRVARFLSICEGFGISVMLTLLDDCEFSGEPPRLGRQPSPEAGVHNSRAVGSPGRAMVMTPEEWHKIELYVKDVIGEFVSDSRVAIWDLYNEPSNRMIFNAGVEQEFDVELEEHSLRLMELCFMWAREVGPTQPLTVAAWHTPSVFEPDRPLFGHPTDQRALELSDIISFHAYMPLEQMQQAIEFLKSYERPLICSEWMGRHVGSLLTEQLPLFCREAIGCYQWGLVEGKTQTYLPWPMLSRINAASSGDWFHDVLHSDGSAYDKEETDLVRNLTAANRNEQRGLDR